MKLKEISIPSSEKLRKELKLGVREEEKRSTASMKREREREGKGEKEGK